MTSGSLEHGAAVGDGAASASDRATLAWLAPRAIPGVERVEADGYERTVPGDADPVRATIVDGGLEIEGGEAGTRAMRDVFAVGADVTEAEAAIVLAARRHDVPALEHAVRRSPGLRLPGCADPHEMLYRAIVGQQISVAAATRQLELLAGLGTPLDGHEGWWRFPDDEAIAAGAVGVPRGPRAKSEAVARAAEALADGTIDMTAPTDELQEALVALRGIGPWTAGYVALRLGDPDVLLLGDVAVRAGARRLGVVDLPALAADCAPFRSHLMLRCWAA